jgi:hypothetical protein
MKATIDIPDDLYLRVKATSERLGRPVDAVVADLIQRSLDEDAGATRQLVKQAANPPSTSTKTRRELAQEWLDEWLLMGEEAHRSAPSGPSAREILEEGRNRLERR